MTKFLSFLIFLALALSVVGQKSDDQKKKDKTNKYPQSGTVHVKTNLLVLDAKDQYSEDVKPEDIKLFEDGVLQKLTKVDKKLPPMHVGLVIDNSGSMRTTIESAINAAKLVVTNLQDGDGSFVVRYVSSDKVELIQNYTDKKAELLEAIDNLYIEGGQSAMFDGIYLAAENVVKWEKTAPKNRFAIILISDGEDRASYYDLDQLLKVLSGTELQVFPLFFTNALTDGYNTGTKERFGKSNSQRLARILALRTGGLATFIDRKPDEVLIKDAVRSIMIDLRSQYVVSYESTNQKRDGLERRLTVEIADGPNGAKRKGFIRPSFVVPLD